MGLAAQNESGAVRGHEGKRARGHEKAGLGRHLILRALVPSRPRALDVTHAATNIRNPRTHPCSN
jgi:hypothetical protein